MMGRSRQDILNKKETGKMCLSDGNELDEMCSVEDNDTRGKHRALVSQVTR